MRPLVLLLALAVLAGCGQPVAGVPAPVTGPGPTVAAAPELPPRPREVPLDGVDPCTLLTDEDRTELGLDQPPVPNVGTSALYGGEIQQCAVRGFEPRAISVSVLLSVTGGIELYFRPGVRSEITPIEVAGFPAIVALPVTIRDFCTVVVDVAPGQVVDVQVASGGRQPPIPQEQLCVDAEVVAGIVMGNLLAQG
ncbi:hypothetical protein GCM10010210_31740 [Pseudonocardia hydrocarbonoxydans]|uniref:DUF3558 domain-containing protein n=1 Tax=Pseudonocardia hydrocarbonoxydans TaxID=76726 RepID=A0A4Y3WK76_9PSEU|nr:hypothetical protein PHY01_15360 [Pseudonocardia hydrocarbonoxydans]